MARQGQKAGGTPELAALATTGYVVGAMQNSSATVTTDHPAVSKLQIARYREMTGEQRLETGLRLWEFAREFIAASIHNERPTLSESEVLRHAVQRMQQ